MHDFMLLTDAAMRQVHRASRGFPRLINAICDRALLGAYAHSTVTGAYSVPRLLIPHDGHPNAFSTELIAGELKRNLLPQ